MSPQEIKFVLFWVLNLSALALGYILRKRGLMREEHSRPIHLYTVVILWSASGLLGVWKASLSWALIWYIPVVFGIMLATTCLTAAWAKAARLSREQIGTLAVGGGVANTGATMGVFVCYCLLQPASSALGLASVYTATQGASIAVIGNATARRYGHANTNESMLHLLYRTMTDIRSANFYFAGLGLTLSLAQVPFPRQIVDWHILDAILYAASIGGHFGIGLRLRLRLNDLGDFWKQHVILNVMRYIATPLLVLLILWLINRTPLPLGQLAWEVALIQNAMPAGVSIVMLSNLYALDTRLAGSAWFWNLIVFMTMVMPVLVWLTR